MLVCFIRIKVIEMIFAVDHAVYACQYKSLNGRGKRTSWTWGKAWIRRKHRGWHARRINKRTAKDRDATSLRHPLVTTCLFVFVVRLVLQVTFKWSFAVSLKGGKQRRALVGLIFSSTMDISWFLHFAVPADR